MEVKPEVVGGAGEKPESDAAPRRKVELCAGEKEKKGDRGQKTE
jgi:hypothetical protein